MTENDGMLGNSVVPPIRTVLIVEDSAGAASALEMAAQEIPGVTVAMAASALEALRILDDEGRAIHLIITDLNMPQMDGFELIARVRAGVRHRRTPIVVVSADTDPSTPQRIRGLGADAFFSKPYSPAQVCRKLEQLLDAPRE